MTDEITPTIATLIEHAEAARVAAMAAGNISAAVSAIKELGILSGLRVTKQVKRTFGNLDHMSDAELDAMILKLQNDLRETAH